MTSRLGPAEPAILGGAEADPTIRKDRTTTYDDPAYELVGHFRGSPQIVRDDEGRTVGWKSGDRNLYVCLNCAALVAEEHRSAHGLFHIDTGTNLPVPAGVARVADKEDR